MQIVVKTVAGKTTRLPQDKGVVLAAVQQDGLLLEHVHDPFRKDREVVLAAVRQSGSALRYALEAGAPRTCRHGLQAMDIQIKEAASMTASFFPRKRPVITQLIAHGAWPCQPLSFSFT